MSTQPIRHGYAIIRAVLDDLRARVVNIGVVAWDSDQQWFGIRTLAEGERVPQVNSRVRMLADVAEGQLRAWSTTKNVPYSGHALEPWTGEFWVAAAEVMTTAIRIDSPRSMAPMSDTDTEMDLLFEAVVKPQIGSERRFKRIDGAISNALGGVADQFKKSVGLPAFQGVNETVLRGAVGTNSTLIIEGVNLAASSARKDADALVSKLLRIRAGSNRNALHFIVGYVSSPGGLNGESDMRDWIREQVTQEVFDVVTDQARFRRAALDQLRQVGLNAG